MQGNSLQASRDFFRGQSNAEDLPAEVKRIRMASFYRRSQSHAEDLTAAVKR